MSGQRALNQTALSRSRCCSPSSLHRILTWTLHPCPVLYIHILLLHCKTEKLRMKALACDIPLCLQMMYHLAQRLRDLHRLGYVHRDLKPGNVMWLPRENRWTVIDFGCAARSGEDARLGFSVAYAAPEVIRVYRAGAVTMVAQVRILSCFYSLA
jgi:serine/threonine protein kinase